jgi:ankyrin repeat protein
VLLRDGASEIPNFEHAQPNIADRNGRIPLHYPRHGEAAEKITKLLQAGADTGKCDEDGNTPLHLIVRDEDNIQGVEALIEAGADPRILNNSGETALESAAWYGDKRMMTTLLDGGAGVEFEENALSNALMKASMQKFDRGETVRYLLERGANARYANKMGKMPLHEICRYSSSFINDMGNTSDQVHAAQALIEFGAEVNATYTDKRKADWYEHDVTPIGLAAENADGKTSIDLIKVLLDAGANPDGFSINCLPALLQCCAFSPRVDSMDDTLEDIVGLMLDVGGDISTVDRRGLTGLHHAAEASNFKAAMTLLSRGAQLEQKDDLGRTPLLLACWNQYWMTNSQRLQFEATGEYMGEEYAKWHVSQGSCLLLEVLKAHGADSYATDKDEVTALHIASKSCNPRIVASFCCKPAGHYFMTGQIVK